MNIDDMNFKRISGSVISASHENISDIDVSGGGGIVTKNSVNMNSIHVKSKVEKYTRIWIKGIDTEEEYIIPSDVSVRESQEIDIYNIESKEIGSLFYKIFNKSNNKVIDVYSKQELVDIIFKKFDNSSVFVGTGIVVAICGIITMFFSFVWGAAILGSAFIIEMVGNAGNSSNKDIILSKIESISTQIEEDIQERMIEFKGMNEKCKNQKLSFSSDYNNEIKTKNCPECNSPLKEGVNFCTNCGAKISEIPSSNIIICSKCDEVNDINSKFCKKCGEKL